MENGMTLHATAAVQVTPSVLAELFWEMDATQQAEFFATLNRVAGYKLCIQMAGVVREITLLSGEGDFDAQLGFETMLAHAKDYHESATDWRTWEAQAQVARMAEQAKSRIGGAA